MAEITCEWLHPILIVEDVKATAEFYRDKLGFEVEFLWGDPVTYGAVKLGEKNTIHFDQGDSKVSGVSLYVSVWNAPEALKLYRQAGVEIVEDLNEKPWGWREFVALDNNGIRLRVGQPIPAEKITIERAPLETRIEKRLLAVIEDLANSKNMSLGEMLEETLLHTFEETSHGSVASPHTQETHQLIDQLRKKHGMNFDAHAAYRFEEKG